MHPSHGLRNLVARRVFLLFLTCAILPFVVLATVAYFELRGRLSEPYLEMLRQTTKTAGMSVVSYLASAETRLDVVADLLIESDDLRPAVARFDRLLTDTFRSFTLTTLDGEPLDSYDWNGADFALTSAERRHVAEGKAVVAVRSGQDGSRRIYMARLLHADGRAARVLVGELQPTDQWPVEQTSGASSFAIVDADGWIHTTLEIPTDPLRRLTAGAAVSGTEEWMNAGETMIATFWTMFLTPEYGVRWTVVCARPEAELKDPVRMSMVVLALGMILASLTPLLIGVHMIRRRLGPIAQLREATREIAQNDFAVRVHIDSGDELGELGESFNQMARHIQLRTEELERANQVKIEFLANVSHEIRTPMFAILGHAEECRQADLRPHQLRANLDVIRESGKHLMAIIADLLEVSSIETGRLMVRHVNCSLPPIIDEVVSVVEPMAHESGIELVVEVADDLPEHTYTDPGRLRQVLLNLIGNAIKFTDEGRVTLHVRTGPGRPEHDMLVFEVRDTGIGIAPDQMARVFEPFVQIDGSAGRRFGGFGIGLSVSRTIARRLGGDIEAESCLGEGSRFTLTIESRPPASNAPTPDADPSRREQASEAAAPLPPGLRVLLAEDVAVNRRLVTVMLERGGIEVDPAENGRVAYEKAKRAMDSGRPYDIVFMDVQMPELTGLEATRRLRAEGYEHPIVALTAHAMKEERQRCHAAGCDDFATKPIDRRALLEIVRRHVEAPDPAGLSS